MLLPFVRSGVQVCGSEPLLSQVVAGLRADARAVRPITLDTLAGPARLRIRTLVLADPPDPGAVVAALLERRRRRRSGLGRQPIRLILMHRGETPPLPRLAECEPWLGLETFAVEERAARAVLTRWPLHAGMDPPFGQVPHLLCVGTGALAHAFLVQALRLMQYGAGRPRVTLLSAAPESEASRLRVRLPHAGQVADLCVAALAEPPLAGAPPVTLALVCPDPADEAALDIATRLARQIAARQSVSPPILLEIGGRDTAGELADWDGQILPFSALREVCRAGVLLDGVGDEVAQTIHEHYCDSIAAQGRDPTGEPAGQPWPRLATSYREANRHQADHLWAKLAVTDCTAVAEEMVDAFAFAPLEVERLALIEHQRWAADRHLDGWSYAPVRDNARKHHPQLIPYEALSEPMKDLDRFAVRGVPTLLARSGLGILRRLIVAFPEPGAQAPAGVWLRRLTRQVLERLVTRYPDRALVVAATLRDATIRQLVRQALEQAGARFFWLLPEPIGELLALQPDRAARLDLLALAARAERRIALAGDAELARWCAERAEILCLLGRGPVPSAPARRVELVRAWQGASWNFEY